MYYLTQDAHCSRTPNASLIVCYLVFPCACFWVLFSIIFIFGLFHHQYNNRPISALMLSFVQWINLSDCHDYDNWFPFTNKTRAYLVKWLITICWSTYPYLHQCTFSAQVKACEKRAVWCMWYKIIYFGN